MKYSLSICIPAYNRSDLLSDLIESILSQDLKPYEIIICEDNSPQREKIRGVVEPYRLNGSGRIRYFENTSNLGYDANLRRLIECSTGDYCLFMGNDDLLAPGALSHVAGALERYDDIGVVLRSYASFEGSPDNINQVFRYFEKEMFFPASEQSIITFYRRSVVISGMILHRNTALKYGSSKFDGTLLYQLFLVANILTEKNGVFLPEIIALYREGGVPEFGSSEKEKNKFVPKDQTPESSLHFVQGMLDIVTEIEKQHHIDVYRHILRDIANYSYPILAIQSQRPAKVFINYYFEMAKKGLGSFILFHFYFIVLLLLGKKIGDRLIALIKSIIGHTPEIGNIFKGVKA